MSKLNQNETVTNFLKDLQKNFNNLEHLNPLEFAKQFINLEEFQKIQAKQQEQIKKFVEQYNNIDYSTQFVDFSNKLKNEINEKIEQTTEIQKQFLNNITPPEYKQHLEHFFKVNDKLANINNQMLSTTHNYFTQMMNLNKEGLSLLQSLNPMFLNINTTKTK